jgi:endonuclease/exonuclease/phosphatase family metal-dependent hydrolase
MLSILAAAWLLGCATTAMVSPQRFRYLALFNITAPFAIAANVLTALGWLLLAGRKWPLVFPLLALGFSYRLIPLVFGVHPFATQDMIPGPGKLKLMSWNVHGLGIFDRPRNRTADDSIIRIIRDEAPDLLCLYEFYTSRVNALKPYSTRIMTECGYKEFRFRYDNTIGSKIYLGIAIFSRYPLSNFESHPLHRLPSGEADVLLSQVDVSLPGDRQIRLFATHLQSFMLSDVEKSYLSDVSSRDSELKIERSRSFVRRFGLAYVKRAAQADEAAAIIAQSPYPVLLCGDFNDLPGSYTYTRMKGSLRDAFAQKGFGLGKTYNFLSPTLRIDHIFYDKRAFEIVGFRSPKTRLSDHNPVIANFRLR